MIAVRSAVPGRRTYSKHGLTLLKQAVKGLDGRVIDMRTSLGKALAEWRADLVADLGGRDAVSTQQAAVIDLAVKTKLLLDSRLTLVRAGRGGSQPDARRAVAGR